MSEKTPADIIRGAGLKVTPQRILIYGKLSGADDHPSTAMLYGRIRKVFPDISFDTVYRTLLTFSRTGIISAVEGTGEELRFEPNPEPHHHFRCVKCRVIIDFHDDLLDNITISEKTERSFNILSRRVVLDGVCHSCRGKPRITKKRKGV